MNDTRTFEQVNDIPAYSPGPITIEGPVVRRGCLAYVLSAKEPRVDGDRWEIATLDTGSDPDSAGNPDDLDGRCNAMTLANATLFAAAGDLLAACQALIDAPHHEHFATRLNDQEMATVELIRAAIAKATGGAK